MLCAVTRAPGAVTVVASSNPETLAHEILGAGVSIVPGSPTYTGAAVAAGLFTNGLTSGLGFQSGIILTSGNAYLAQGGNASDSISGVNGLPGDADLDATLPAGRVSYDAAILEFDFVCGAGDLSFSYVFASDEYNEYVNTTYGDVFGFFLDGVNIALVPGTNIPVSVHTVNGGGPAFGTNPSHPELFNNNDWHDGGPFFDFEYDGFTTVLTAEALGLAAGVHHIKFAIADVGDRLCDSAILIETGTFSAPSPPAEAVVVPLPAAVALGTLGVGMVVHLRRRRAI
jgi:hypothetical protein